MITHYVLIDYENVQPKDLVLLRGRNCRTMVFVGKDQKLTVECAASLQPTTLVRALVARFPAQLAPDTARQIIEKLQKNALLAFEGERVKYNL